MDWRRLQEKVKQEEDQAERIRNHRRQQQQQLANARQEWLHWRQTNQEQVDRYVELRNANMQRWQAQQEEAERQRQLQQRQELQRVRDMERQREIEHQRELQRLQELHRQQQQEPRQYSIQHLLSQMKRDQEEGKK